ncbi:serine hydrolase domain-containing protein [Saccharomonospora iraqiensis]|uniref:serine hydrolase domain-containing protein n=1 Tax=Saccharomonospora iraqiensis TaxID=52698 RepID=UPI00022E0797|nr:serine hydrolase domain-containing protein [Saccharomonospora iraqiensis]
MDTLRLVEQWPVPHAAVAVIRPDGTVPFAHGDRTHVFPLASVTKLLTAHTTLIAVEEGALELDTPAGPEGATVRHLLAHTAGLGFNDHTVYAAPGERRLYSSAGFEQLAAAVAEHTGIAFDEYQKEALFQPLGMVDTRLEGSPGAGASSTLDDLLVFARELQEPALIDRSTLDLATRVAFAGLNGVLPGFGHQKPNDWGLGFEIRDGKDPHWTGKRASPRTFGHFGQSGTFLWVDPDAELACVALTDRDFGPWAAEAWPEFSDAVLAELA